MKIFEVDSKLNFNTMTSLLSPVGRISSSKKAFATKEKAEEYYKQLYSAANLLGIGGYLEANIHELEIEWLKMND